MKKLLRVLGRLFLALLFLAAAALVTLGLLRWRGLILLPDEADPDEWEVFGVGTRQSLKSVHSDLPHAKYIGLLLYQNSGGNRRGQAFFLACPRPVYPNRSNSAWLPRKMFRSMRRWVP